MKTQKVIFFISSLYFFIPNSSLAQTPEKVYRYCYTQESQDWYEEQSDYWKAELELAPDNLEAWYNYFFATRYANFSMDEKERTKLLNSIIEELGNANLNSYLYHYLKYYNGDRKVAYLEKALQLNPNCADLFWEFIQYYELNGISEKRKIFSKRLFESKDIISSLYDYNFNMLNSTEENSILFTNGDNDNYPSWVLQDTKGIRQDVTILNAHTVFVLRDYLKLKLRERKLEIDVDKMSTDDNATFLRELISSIKNKYPDIPIHISLTVYDSYTIEVRDKLYLTGLVNTYSEEPFDNVSIIKKNLEQNLRLDYLEYDWYNENHISYSMMNRYNLNYIPSFLELTKEYKSYGDIELAQYWYNKSLHLAKMANDESLIEEIKQIKF
jgi:hypothetical protein